MRTLVKRAALVSGHYRRRLARHPHPGVAVLCYHGVLSPEAPAAPALPALHIAAATLAAHCAMLRACCTPISLARWRAALASGEPLPPRPVLVTFDDGYRSVLTAGLPVLRHYRVPAVVFVCSGPVERQRHFWFDRVARGRGPEDVERLKREPFADWLGAADPEGGPVPAADDPDAPLTVDELRRLAADPLIEIGGHTRWHPILARAEPAEQRREIADDRTCLESWIDRPVTAFAYPNGQPGADFDRATIEQVRESGYRDAFTIDERFAVPDGPPLERSRFLVLASVGAAELVHRIAYSWPREPAG